jgi:predicted aminopeptidase
LFHELAHQRVFAAGDTDFNEAFATSVGEEGTRRWLTARGDEAAMKQYETELARKDQFVRLIMLAREKLKVAYGEETEHGPRTKETPGSESIVAQKRIRKQQVFDELRRDYAELKASWGGYSGYDGWFNRSLNNAKLNTIAAYYHLVPAFTYLLRENKGDLKGFYADARFLAAMSKEERKAEAEKLLKLAGSQTTDVAAQ